MISSHLTELAIGHSGRLFTEQKRMVLGLVTRQFAFDAGVDPVVEWEVSPSGGGGWWLVGCRTDNPFVAFDKFRVCFVICFFSFRLKTRKSRFFATPKDDHQSMYGNGWLAGMSSS